MKKNVVIGILSTLVVVLIFTSSHLYKEIKRMKVDVSYDHVLLINESRDAVDNMRATNLQDALETEDGIALIETHKDQTLQKERQFSYHMRPFPKIGNMFYEVYQIQDKVLERGEATEEDIEIYKDRLNKLYYIMMDLEHYTGSARDLFDSFHGEVDPEITEKIDQRIEADY
ncbi:hypothetical protein SAMN05216389_12235 [Oceanobacillus limi]|uniref:Uncharacterized protein n=1 Tax=Oceanobacillus limi TaxID=930131 RepID=A0A1I0GJV1_9BACI|nr:hypothetical protein [Oceanobacillus limi]SET71224.1 hypothetical protein SAMN05216389_12235 [Oceanobacillus limi]